MVEDKLKDIIKQMLPDQIDQLEKITLDDRLSDAFYIDSITMLMIGLAIEETFNVRLTTEDIDFNMTVGELIRIIEEKAK